MKNVTRSKFLSPLLIVAGCAIGSLIGCAGKMHRIEPVPVSVSPMDNPSEKIVQLEQEFTEARSKNVPLLAPTWYQQALTSFNEGKAMRDSRDNLVGTFRKLGEAQIEIRRATEVAVASERAVNEVLNARAQALTAQDAARKAGAVDISAIRDRIVFADRGLVGLTSAVEFNDLAKVDKQKPEVIGAYHDATRLALAKENLDGARRVIAEAKRQGAKKYAPHSLEVAEDTLSRASKVILEGPISREEAGRLGREAEQFASRALRMTYEARNVSQRKPEQIALGVDSRLNAQQKSMSDLTQRANQAESAVQLDQKIAKVRAMFAPSEADVLRDGNRVIVRLKSVKFPSGKAELGASQAALFAKVNEALVALPAQNVTVEGHTDTTGSVDTNATLSQERAEAVKEFLVSKGAVSGDEIQAVGKGSSEPLSNNTTREGRAANRRVDLIVELGGQSTPAQQTAE